MDHLEFQLPNIINHILSSSGIIKVELIVAVTFLVSILSSLFFERKYKDSTLYITLAGLSLAVVSTIGQINQAEIGFFGMINRDNFSVYGRLILMIATLFIALFIHQHYKNKATTKKIPDIYSILLASVVGLNLLTMTTHWLMAFIAIEMVSLSSYILVGYFSEHKRQSEAAVKYALFGSACAAMMLYGISLLYGFTGDLDFSSTAHIQGLISAPTVLCSIAILFLFVGFGFKLSFAPFHVWSPDVYEGAPTPITAFLSTAPKVAVMILFSRLCASWFQTLFYFSELTFLLLVIIAIVTMLVGNFVALRQEGLKRLMAYSSIGHTGFLLMAVLAYYKDNSNVLLYYLSVYTLMNISAFLFIDYLEKKLGDDSLESLKGMGKKLPLTIVGFSLLGVSLIGLPPTAGFVGKFLIFSNVFGYYNTEGELAYLILLVVGAITTVIALFYYLKIPLNGFLKESKTENDTKEHFTFQNCFAFAISIMLIVLGIFPDILLNIL